jgi:hypothetical protein
VQVSPAPIIFRKRQGRLNGGDEIMLWLTARWLTTDRGTFAEVQAPELARHSRVTDKVIEETTLTTLWHNGPWIASTVAIHRRHYGQNARWQVAKRPAAASWPGYPDLGIYVGGRAAGQLRPRRSGEPASLRDADVGPHRVLTAAGHPGGVLRRAARRDWPCLCPPLPAVGRYRACWPLGHR